MLMEDIQPVTASHRSTVAPKQGLCNTAGEFTPTPHTLVLTWIQRILVLIESLHVFFYIF